jgi:hypothetical protein
MPNIILSSPIPENLNPLSPNGYMFTLQRAPGLKYFCQEVSIPTVSLPEATQLTSFVRVPIAGDQLEYDTLRVQFLVDEKMENYKSIHEWITGLGFPETHDQYTNTLAVNNTPGLTEVAKSSSDATLVILGNDNNHIQTIQFIDCIPQSLDSLTFTSTNQDVQYLVGNVTFAYTYYKFI